MLSVQHQNVVIKLDLYICERRIESSSGCFLHRGMRLNQLQDIFLYLFAVGSTSILNPLALGFVRCHVKRLTVFRIRVQALKVCACCAPLRHVLSFFGCFCVE